MRDNGFSGERPTTRPTAAAQLIAAAVSLLGSPVDVRAEMGTTEQNFLEYCAGASEPSSAEFERLIALIVREQGRLIGQNRKLLQQLRTEKKTDNR